LDEVLYLEPDEEITSVIDKIKNTTTANIGLVVPRDATLLQSVVNLRLLAKEAAALGKVIAIVTTDKIGMNLAAQVGIPVFSSVEEQKPIYQPPPPRPSSEEIIEINEENRKVPEAPKNVPVHHFQEKPVIWKKKAAPVLKPEPPQALPKATTNIAIKTNKDLTKARKIIWPILAILVTLGLVGSYLLVPKATAKIYLSSEDLKKSVDVTVLTKANIDTAKNIFPGQLITSQKETQENFPATGQKNIGTKASGTITIYNNFDSSPHTFSAGTKLASSNKTFLTKTTVTVGPFQRINGQDVMGAVKVDIEAEDVGSDYNVKAGRFTILGLPANQQDSIYGQSQDSLKGGDSRQVQVVSQSDFDKAKQQLITQLSNQLTQDFTNKTKNKKIIDKAIVKSDPAVTTSTPVGGEAKNFDMKVKVTEQVMVFDFAQFKDFLTQILTKQVPADKMVNIQSDNDIGFEVKKTVYDKGELDLTTNVLAKVSAKISPESIKTQILGKSASVATGIIQSVNGVEKAEISFWPSWWFKRIPDLSGKVNIEIKYQNQ